jgi:hypothetical protein
MNGFLERSPHMGMGAVGPATHSRGTNLTPPPPSMEPGRDVQTSLEGVVQRLGMLAERQGNLAADLGDALERLRGPIPSPAPLADVAREASRLDQINELMEAISSRLAVAQERAREILSHV